MSTPAAITIEVRDGGVHEVDLGGALDEKCCGCESAALHRAMADLGVQLRLRKVGCRLPLVERDEAKSRGLCPWNVGSPTPSQESYAHKRLSSEVHHE